MYSTCIFCGGSLGRNEAVEYFPVGRRLAFDAARGRLWAVCASCSRWNLTPLEERWEVVEECERLFRDTRVRVSTEQIGLARLPDGTELVRIGEPLRPEFAAWRCGDQFGARARRLALNSVSALSVGAAMAGSLVLGPAALALLAGVPVAQFLKRGLPRVPTESDAARAERTLADAEGAPILTPGRQLTLARLRTGDEHENGWGIELQTTLYELDERGQYFANVHSYLLVGAPARAAASVVLTRANLAGAANGQVREAVRRLARVPSPEAYFLRAEQDARKDGWGYRDLWGMPPEIRLALEMATHEDSERRALEGELAELEARWRAAEEIAAVADRLALPHGVKAVPRR